MKKLFALILGLVLAIPALGYGQGFGYNYQTFKERATAPATPPSTYDRFYFTSSGPVYKNSAGTVIPVLGGFTPLYAADAGSTDAYAITMSPAPTAYAAGMLINFKANTANTDGATLNVNGLGAKNILKLRDQALVTGDIEAAQIVTVVYDGTQFQMQSQVATGAGTQASLHVDDILTALGIASEATHFGTFTGSTIADSQTAKVALQSLETSLETKASLTSPAFTTSILPSAAGATAIGTTLLPFSSIFIGDAATNNVQLINTVAASAVVLTLPSTTGTLALVAETLPITGGTLTGNLLFTDNTHDIGASGATRPKTIYAATSMVAPVGTFSGAVTAGSFTAAQSAAGQSLTLLEATGGSNFRTVSVPTVLAGDADLRHADALPAANQVQMYPAPTTGVSQYAWQTIYPWFVPTGPTQARNYAFPDEAVTIATNSANQTLNFVTTGTISGAIPSTTDANGQTLSALMQYGYMHWATGAGTTNLVTAVAGMNFCVYSTTAAAVVINPADADVILLNGAALSAGDSITSASGAGDFICLVSHEATKWVTLGRSGTWTDTN